MEPGSSLTAALLPSVPGLVNVGSGTSHVSNPVADLAVQPRQKPRWRGVSHLVAACLAAPAALALWFGAGSSAAKLGAAIYGLSLFALFTTSAIYHLPTWTPRARDLVGRIDQAVIFLLIAATYTPFGLLLGASGYLLLALIWAGALGGVVLALLWPGTPKPLMAGIYVLFGWTFLALIPSLLRAAGPAVLSLVILGALAYTVGAVIYALRRPDPWPRSFGYHEIFHLLVIVAAGCHFAAIALALPALT